MIDAEEINCFRILKIFEGEIVFDYVNVNNEGKAIRGRIGEH
jgi:hypothetical protein